MAKFEITQDDKGRFRFTLRGPEGDAIVESEAYSSKKSAENGIDSVQRNAPEDSRYEVKPDQSGAGGYYMSLKAANGEVIAHSRGHTDEQSANNAITLVQQHAPDAEVVDSAG